MTNRFSKITDKFNNNKRKRRRINQEDDNNKLGVQQQNELLDETS